MFVRIGEVVFEYAVEFSLSLALVSDEASPPVMREVEFDIFCGDNVFGIV